MGHVHQEESEQTKPLRLERFNKNESTGAPITFDCNLVDTINICIGVMIAALPYISRHKREEYKRPRILTPKNLDRTIVKCILPFFVVEGKETVRVHVGR